MRTLTKWQIDELKKWPEDKWPNRAYQWALWSFPRKEPNWYEEDMAFETIKRLNRQEKGYTLISHGSSNRTIAYNKLLQKHKKEFHAFLKENGIKPTIYEQFL